MCHIRIIFYDCRLRRNYLNDFNIREDHPHHWIKINNNRMAKNDMAFLKPRTKQLNFILLMHCIYSFIFSVWMLSIYCTYRKWQCQINIPNSNKRLNTSPTMVIPNTHFQMKAKSFTVQNCRQMSNDRNENK